MALLKSFRRIANRNIFSRYSAPLCGTQHQNRTSKRSYYDYSPEPFHPIAGKEPVWMSSEQAVSFISTGMRVFVHGCAATPNHLLDALALHSKEANLKDIEMIHIHTEGPAFYNQPEFDGMFRSNSLFIGGNCREAVNTGRGDFIPIFLSEIPLLFKRKIITLDACLIQVSPPDNHGFCTLGPSVDCARSAIQNAKFIIAQVNPFMPRTFGDSVVHMSHCDAMVHVSTPLMEMKPHKITDAEERIGKLIAENLVLDGATLQMGIGSIPDATLANLKSHRNLGVHSEMFSDGIVDLVENGNVTNAMKKVQTGKIVGSFVMGSRRLFDFMDDNPFVVMCDVAMVNKTAIIAQNPRVTAINSCLEVDLTGQVVSDSIGTRMYSGVGGQVDFIRGAALGFDGQGKPILAMPSVTKRGESKIVPTIKEGAGVVTTRAHVHYIVTEYGIAYLFGKNLRQRAYELIRIAHPDHQASLEQAAFERLQCMPSP